MTLQLGGLHLPLLFAALAGLAGLRSGGAGAVGLGPTAVGLLASGGVAAAQAFAALPSGGGPSPTLLCAQAIIAWLTAAALLLDREDGSSRTRAPWAALFAMALVGATGSIWLWGAALGLALSAWPRARAGQLASLAALLSLGGGLWLLSSAAGTGALPGLGQAVEASPIGALWGLSLMIAAVFVLALPRKVGDASTAGTLSPVIVSLAWLMALGALLTGPFGEGPVRDAATGWPAALTLWGVVVALHGGIGALAAAGASGLRAPAARVHLGVGLCVLAGPQTGDGVTAILWLMGGLALSWLALSPAGVPRWLSLAGLCCLAGVPPSPGFLGRLHGLTQLAGAGYPASLGLIVGLAALALLTLACVRQMAPRPATDRGATRAA